MKNLEFYEEDLLQIVYNILACMESETNNIEIYMKKTNAPKDISINDLFDGLDNAIEYFTKKNK